MIGLVTGGQFAFWMLAPIMVLAAIAMILVRKAVHSALLLATVMVCLAVQYAAQDAPFLFAVQIIVYTGAILMLFLFVLMLVGVDASDSLVETIRGQRLLAGLAFLGFGILLVSAVGNAVYGDPVGLAQAQPDGNPKGIAQLLFGKYVFAFEVTSALLITAALGAMMLAHRERLKPKRTQRDLAEERIRKYAETGVHPGPLPTPGVLARHNAVDTPALLPDGSIAPTSVSRVLQARGTVFPETEERDEIETVRRIADGDAGDVVPPEHTGTDLTGFGEGEKA
ncbi:NADH-quinone oxidoreductase subunit J [Kribbella sp. VKM Ac-2568]|uniref:NADH-quinone oxidoreductase subunit J n=1 Tax=Kribbella sp. VKM Ac-2568 TaxID=2512219 RepID=UPI001051CCCC|nr:NADH-quinone oxidoreductase subunit J [Kribbella sp. VKM Ac-2568]TCM51737.1 NADH-quinone oxidoreductase subunit J [Kribbella sp. VKM Ac-2568]